MAVNKVSLFSFVGDEGTSVVLCVGDLATLIHINFLFELNVPNG